MNSPVKPHRTVTRAMLSQLKHDNAQQSERFQSIPHESWPAYIYDPKRLAVYRNKHFLVQVMQEDNGVIRLTINRTRVKPDGNWEDNLAWEEIQAIKRELGYGDAYAIEIYPSEKDTINEANMRHLWILPHSLDIGWVRHER